MQKLSRVIHFVCVFAMPMLFVALAGGCVPPGHMKTSLMQMREENMAMQSRIYNDKWRLEEFRQENAVLKKRVKGLEEQLAGREQIPDRMRQLGPARSAEQGAGIGGASVVKPADNPGTKTYNTVISPSASRDTVPVNPPEVEKGEPSRTLPSGIFSDDPFLEEFPIHPATGSAVTVGEDALPRRVHVRKTDSESVYRVKILPESVVPSNYEGFYLNFQMLDAENREVLAAAPITVSVYDPSISERLSWWEFSPEYIADKLINAGEINYGNAGVSLPLGMQWRSGCPKNLKLRVHILYVTSDGRRLTDEVFVDMGNPVFFQPTTTAGSADKAETPAGMPVFPRIGGNAGTAAIPLKRPVWTPEAE